LGVLFGGLGIGKWQFLIKNIKIKFPAVIFLNFKSSNPGSGSGSAIRKNAGSVSGSALNQCGSETLLFIVFARKIILAACRAGSVSQSQRDVVYLG
jgi:hypothetical protein